MRYRLTIYKHTTRDTIQKSCVEIYEKSKPADFHWKFLLALRREKVKKKRKSIFNLRTKKIINSIAGPRWDDERDFSDNILLHSEWRAFACMLLLTFLWNLFIPRSPSRWLTQPDLIIVIPHMKFVSYIEFTSCNALGLAACLARFLSWCNWFETSSRFSEVKRS